MKLSDCSKSLEHTLKDSNLHNLSASNLEVILDGFMNDGIAKDLPIIGAIIGTGKVVAGIREALFLKKLIYFICELSEIPHSERKRVIEAVDSSEKYRAKVGEKLLFVIDKCDDHEKSQIVAKLFAAFLRENLSYDDFLRAVSVVENVVSRDLHWFVAQKHDCFDLSDLDSILNSGLVELNIYDQADFDMKLPKEYKLNAYVSDIGSKIRSILTAENNTTILTE